MALSPEQYQEFLSQLRGGSEGPPVVATASAGPALAEPVMPVKPGVPGAGTMKERVERAKALQADNAAIANEKEAVDTKVAAKQAASANLLTPANRATMMGLNPEIVKRLEEGSYNKEDVSTTINATEVEKPSILGNLKHGAGRFDRAVKKGVGKVTGAFGEESIFSGDKIGEIGSELVLRGDNKFRLDDSRKIFQTQLDRMRERGDTDEQVELAKANAQEALDILEQELTGIAKVDRVELAADVGLVALDIMSGGKAKAAAVGIGAGARAAKGSGIKGLLKNTIGKISIKEGGKGVGIGAGFGGLEEVKQSGDVDIDTAIAALKTGAITAATLGLLKGAGSIGGNNGKKLMDLINADPNINKNFKTAFSQGKGKTGNRGRIMGFLLGDKRTIEPNKKIIAASNALLDEVDSLNTRNPDVTLSQIRALGKSKAKSLEGKLKTVRVVGEKRVKAMFDVADDIEKNLVQNKEFQKILTVKDKKLLLEVVEDLKSAQSVDDLWKARIKYDKFTSSSAKDASEFSSDMTQLKQKVWLDNRGKLNDLMDEVANESSVKKDFEVMSGLYEAADNLIEKSPKLMDSKGIINIRNLVGIGATAVGGTAIHSVLSGR